MFHLRGLAPQAGRTSSNILNSAIAPERDVDKCAQSENHEAKRHALDGIGTRQREPMRSARRKRAGAGAGTGTGGLPVGVGSVITTLTHRDRGKPLNVLSRTEAASLLPANGVDLAIACARLEPLFPRTTADIYSHAIRGQEGEPRFMKSTQLTSKILELMELNAALDPGNYDSVPILEAMPVANAYFAKRRDSEASAAGAVVFFFGVLERRS